MPDETTNPERVLPPGAYIKDELDRRGWTQDDLARILDRPRPTINRILLGKHAIMPELAIALGEAFGNDPGLWMAKEAAYRLSLVQCGRGEVSRRAKLYELAPIKEMEKRQWIRPTDSTVALEAELKRFFDTTNLETLPHLKGLLCHDQISFPA
jgi:HTH-type transcriptional regulator / antitoxin HigA